MLNLTQATSFDQFVREVREDRLSVIAAMPHYRRSLTARKLQCAADVIRRHPSNPPHQQHWTGRVTYERDGVIRPLSDHWPAGGPLWVRATVGAFRLATSTTVLPVTAALIEAVRTSLAIEPGPVAPLGGQLSPSSTGPQPVERVG